MRIISDYYSTYGFGSKGVFLCFDFEFDVSYGEQRDEISVIWFGYLLLKKTLYGLRRSPRHWFETCKAALESLGLHSMPNAPCVFSGTILEGHPPLYLGLFVDDFCYFSLSSDVERAFEEKFGKMFTIDFQGDITHFLGIKFTNQHHEDGHVTCHMSQPVDIENLIKKVGLHHTQTNPTKTPYRSGHPVDSVPHDDSLPPSERAELNQYLQEIVGAMNWIAGHTRPDISTITNILAQYNHNCSKGHIDAAKYAIRYLLGTQDYGIQFSSKNKADFDSFVQFPLDPTEIMPLSDANWGPQDQSVPNPADPPEKIDLFKSRSIAGYIIWFGGPVDWMSKRQSYTARSSCESEIGAVDECTKALKHITNILKDLQLFHKYVKGPITIFNDNAATVQWSENMTSRGLCYIQIRENAVREEVQAGNITVEHIQGKHNVSDMFTKEDRDDVNHFCAVRNAVCTKVPKIP